VEPTLKKIQILLIILLLTTTVSVPEALSKKQEINNELLAEYSKGYRYEKQGWIYTHIEGQPYERGYQYGYLTSDEIIDIIYRWCQWGYENRIKSIINIKNEEQIWSLYKKYAKNLFLDKIPEEYIKEMKGIADGINSKKSKLFDKEIEFEDILTLQLFQDVFYSCFKYRFKKFHPIRGIMNGIKNFISKIMGKNENEHCIAFIATGNATKNGEIIASHSTLFNPLIAEKCNIILDVKPSQGYRFIMTTYPGAIWSCEDYYQNERGIILTETELPQGPWTKKGVPKGVRSRNAIQYSSNIDEVISYLMKGNNGLIPNEWLVGDTKTGEIASLEQALFNTPIKRTFNGFYWSCNYPHNQKVKRELYGISSFLLDISMKIMSNNVYFAKIKRLMKIADEMYGNIDIKNAKKILATDPLSYSLTDGKITSTTLMNNMTFLAHLGNPDGSTWVPTQDFKNKYSRATVFPAMGWVEINPLEIAKQNTSVTSLTEENIYQKQENKISHSYYIILVSISIALFLSIFSIYYNYKKWRNKK